MFYYKQVKDGKIVSVEAKNVDSTSPHFVRATKAAYNDYIASLPPPPSPLPPEPVRDLAAEIDGLKTRLDELEAKKQLELERLR